MGTNNYVDLFMGLVSVIRGHCGKRKKQYWLPASFECRILHHTLSWIRVTNHSLPFSKQICALSRASAVKAFRKNCGKRRNCSHRAISPFRSVFSTLFENFPPSFSSSKLSSANSFGLEESYSCCLEKNV